MKKTYVHMKGTKDGLVLRLDDQCAYAELVEELKHKVADGGVDGPIDVQLHFGMRFCTDEQKQELMKIVHQNSNMLVTKVMSDVITVEECSERIALQKSDTYVGVVRNGQILRSTGDVIILGDVNPNGRVEAGGNVYVLGKLKGIAHAGVPDNEQAIVAASLFLPSHIGIANVIETMSNEQSFVRKHSDQTCAYINDGQITYTHIQEMKKLRPLFNTVKGGS
jgi:septum site-determining protein MinC